MRKRLNAKCIVLKSRNHKDADKFVTLYSKEHGKFVALAKSVRKISSRRLGNLDTLNYISLTATVGENDFKFISEAHTISSFKHIKKSLGVSIHAFYIVELVDRFIRDDIANIEIFDLLLKTLTLLNKSTVASELITAYFELNFVKLLGYGLTFDKCVVCEKEFTSDWGGYSIDFSRGGFLCSACTSSGNVVSVLHAKYLNALAVGRLPRLKNTAPSDYNYINGLLKSYVKDLLEVNIKSGSIMF